MCVSKCLNTLPGSSKGTFFSCSACQFWKASTAHLSLYWVLLGSESLSKKTSSLQPFGGQNWKDHSIAASSISQNCKWGCQCKAWMLLLNKPKLWKNRTLFITLINNYVHAIIKQKKTKFDYLRGLSVFVFIVNELGTFEKPFHRLGLRASSGFPNTREQ